MQVANTIHQSQHSQRNPYPSWEMKLRNKGWKKKRLVCNVFQRLNTWKLWEEEVGKEVGQFTAFTIQNVMEQALYGYAMLSNCRDISAPDWFHTYCMEASLKNGLFMHIIGQNLVCMLSFAILFICMIGHILHLYFFWNAL